MRPLYFVCTMILSQLLAKAMDHFLVLLDLSANFETIDHDNLFYILEKYVGIGGIALRLIRSYFCDRTQGVQIDGILSEFASLLCVVPKGSVLGPIQLCLYLLPLGVILRHHNIGYHIYTDDNNSTFHLSIQNTPTMANSLFIDNLPFANVSENVMLNKNKSQNNYCDINS